MAGGTHCSACKIPILFPDLVGRRGTASGRGNGEGEPGYTTREEFEILHQDLQKTKILKLHKLAEMISSMVVREATPPDMRRGAVYDRTKVKCAW